MRRLPKILLLLCFLLLFAKSASVLIAQMLDAKTAEDARLRAEELVGLALPGSDMGEWSVVQEAEARRQDSSGKQEQILSETENVCGEMPSGTEDTGKTMPLLYEDAVTQAMNRMDIEALQQENSDVVGWIFIPDTPISYPILQGEDNSYYLTHTWEHTESSSGSIFLEEMCSRDWTDENTIIYGHRMKDRSMFGSLVYYQEQEYREEHPYLYVADNEGCRVYEIFAAYEANTDAPVYQVGKLSEEKKQELIDWSIEKSVMDVSVVPQPDEKMITLSTCAADNRKEKRWILQGVLKGISPAGD